MKQVNKENKLNSRPKHNEIKTTKKVIVKNSQKEDLENIKDATLKISKTQQSEIKNKLPKPVPKVKAQNSFVDKYLEFYDDIKIPSRRYDW